MEAISCNDIRNYRPKNYNRIDSQTNSSCTLTNYHHNCTVRQQR
ncbi:hypothetical protein FGIG_10519 [Fasciola gigantica]|uniref:Uncharacterized protein n=1 Tax=Fasciola gigantica TaxID=46835 RepID=A0A504YA37_FASGI|nr:hypothetical protein FGIG_10519 [Fasciola gigantica]